MTQRSLLGSEKEEKGSVGIRGAAPVVWEGGETEIH